MSHEVALFQWEQGARRLTEVEPGQRHALERVRDGIVAELRRRLGGPFTSGELVALYDRGTDWCLALAAELVPDLPAGWDSHLAADAAFARYLREASDFAGGRLTA